MKLKGLFPGTLYAHASSPPLQILFLLQREYSVPPTGIPAPATGKEKRAAPGPSRPSG
ncbi:hypothetical protein Daudx_1054 [Candidatus Desulforudis audaxviator]|nr:hypothetical protein Daudx_1054 [Candidatus Desulforudis audaxviator]